MFRWIRNPFGLKEIIDSQLVKIMKKHTYQSSLQWTGNLGQGTAKYNSYSRDYNIDIENKATILGSSDPAFLGDPARHNPEELLLCSISSCHMLWYLHLATTKGIVVVDYSDHATAVMMEKEDGSGYFESATLNPIVTITDPAKLEEANALHKEANKYCFIANSVNFKICHQPHSKV
jgi:organic hydroperoxide reductase OsmC/OhrA